MNLNTFALLTVFASAGIARNAAATLPIDGAPFAIPCTVSLSTPNIWASTQEWAPLIDDFSDRNAKIIGPIWGHFESGKAVCPGIPRDKRVTFKSNFTVTTNSIYVIEALVDDEGRITIRKGDNTVFTSEIIRQTTLKVARRLGTGNYSIEIEAIDSGSKATGALLSIRDAATDVVLKNSRGDSSWTATITNLVKKSPNP